MVVEGAVGFWSAAVKAGAVWVVRLNGRRAVETVFVGDGGMEEDGVWFEVCVHLGSGWGRAEVCLFPTRVGICLTSLAFNSRGSMPPF